METISPTRSPSAREALLWEREAGGLVRCNLCAHRCLIDDGRRGICQVRENRGGQLLTLVHGQVISQLVDPIEKKPLFHFCPGSRTYSIATPGCNFRCRWCQNWEIALPAGGWAPLPGHEISPDRVVSHALESGCRSIAYTYTEPTIFFEFALDTARVAHSAGLRNVWVTNGYMTEEALELIRPHVDAANVDLKAFHDKTYRRWIGARLQPVLNTLRRMRRLGIWLEVTTLVIPTINDDPMELREAARFIAHELGPDTPWHLSRFIPAHRMREALPTPNEALQSIRRIGLEEGLNYVYVGNVAEDQRGDTLCPDCGALLIRRRGHDVVRNRIQGNTCPACGSVIPGIELESAPLRSGSWKGIRSSQE